MKAGSSRGGRWLAIGFAVVLLVVTVDTSAWLVVTGRILGALPAFTTLAAQQGWTIRLGAAHRSGWPWAATVRLDGVSASTGGGPPALRWSADVLALTIAPTDPRTLHIEPSGAQAVAVAGLAPIAVRAGRAVLLVPLDGAGPARLDAAAVVLSQPGHAGEVTAARLSASFAGLATSGAADAIRLRPALAPPFDGPAALSWRVVLNHSIPALATAAQSAAAWQRGGGQAALPDFVLAWGPLSIQAAGSGGLDGALQPDGHVDLRVQGGGALLDALEQAGRIPSAPATAAKAVLDVLALAAPGAPVPIPLVLQGRVASVAGFPLLRLPEVTWSTDRLGP